MSLRLIALSAMAAALPAHASIAISNPALPYTQSFDSLTTTSSPATSWTNDVTLHGWSLFISTGAAAPTYAADSGSSNAGSFRSYGTVGSTDRALGGLGSGGTYFGSPLSGAIAGWIAVALTNTSGAAFKSFNLSFDGEQWRNGGNNNAQTMVLEYGFGNSFGGVASWTAPGGGFNWTSPVTGSTAAALDGNAAANRVAGVGGSVNTTWAAGETLWLRWVERNDVGNDHGLAIDNFALGVTAVPEPETYALMLAGLMAVGFMARRRI